MIWVFIAHSQGALTRHFSRAAYFLFYPSVTASPNKATTRGDVPLWGEAYRTLLACQVSHVAPGRPKCPYAVAGPEAGQIQQHAAAAPSWASAWHTAQLWFSLALQNLVAARASRRAGLAY